MMPVMSESQAGPSVGTERESGAIVGSLLQPSAFPDRTTSVEHAETHISHVFLTEQYAYKLKKAVRFPFLDYSSKQLRLQACHDELRLNRRLAPSVYIDVLPISATASGLVKVGGVERVVDYCVRMRRLPADRMLDHMIRGGTATRADIERVLDVLMPFYTSAARGSQIDGFATASSIESNARQNLKMVSVVGGEVSRATLQRVRCSQLQYLKLSAGLFADRIQGGFVCEGHGDLRPEHVCLLDDRPVIFDCVEFSLPFRSADAICELAFLAMECDLLGAPELGKAVLDGYRTRSSDDAPDRLASFYKSYRACVRAKVESLRAAQETGAVAEQSLDRSRRYLQLASFYATDFYQPRLFVMIGAAGTGKSTVADALSDALGLEIIRTDTIRHQLAGHREPTTAYGDGIYSDAFTRSTYDSVFARAEALLAESVSVVLDGTFRNAEFRDRAMDLGRRCGAIVHFIRCHCPAETARERIRVRLARDRSESDARPELHDLQQSELDRATDLSSRPVIAIDTSTSPELAVTAVLKSFGASMAGHK